MTLNRTILFLLLVIYIDSFAQSYNGYTLYFPQGGTKAYLTDMTGNTYHTWTFNSNASTTYASYLLSGGILLRTVNHQGNSFIGGPISGEVQRVDWNGTVVWDYVYSTTNYCSHHDIHPMPNGNVLLIAYERKTASEVIQAGCSQSIEMWPDKIVEIQPSGTNGGTVVWEWHAWDHLVQHHDATKNNYGVVASHPELLNINYNTSKDWIHMNGIDYNTDLDQIVFSSHALNEIYVIDHSTTSAQAASHAGGNSGKGGDFIYRWGNPAAYETAGITDFNVVHDAHWISSENPCFPNALCGYNNKGGVGGKTCVDILYPPYDGYNYSLTSGNSYAPSTYGWRYTYNGNVQQDNGNSQQLPNGNTLICMGMGGLIYEINSNQTLLWSKSVGGTIAQAFRYPPCFVNGSYSATVSASETTICSGNSTQLNAASIGDTVYTYSWTSDPPGFLSDLKNPVVNPLTTTDYTVTITNGPCSASASVTVTVNAPLSIMTSAIPSAICKGLNSQLSAAVSGGTIYSYNWTSNPPGFISTEQNPEVAPLTTTTFYVSASSGDCIVSDSVKVIVNLLPETPVIIAYGDSLVSNGISYNQWHLNGIMIEGATQQFYTPTEPGSYQVSAADVNGCESELSQSYLYTALSYIKSAVAINIHPVPTTGILNVSNLEIKTDVTTFSIYSSTGQHILTSPAKPSIDISYLKPGFYYIMLRQNEKIILTQKVILHY
jgi:hypothetical protein